MLVLIKYLDLASYVCTCQFNIFDSKSGHTNSIFMDLFIYALKTYTHAHRIGQYNMENKEKDELYFPSPNKTEEIYVLELRAVHGTFIIQNLHVDNIRNDAPSSPKNFLNQYNHMTFTSYFNFPVPRCSNTGYSKST